MGLHCLLISYKRTLGVYGLNIIKKISRYVRYYLNSFVNDYETGLSSSINSPSVHSEGEFII